MPHIDNNYSCDACFAVMSEVIKDSYKVDSFEDALTIDLTGGYGEYFDKGPFEESFSKIIICKSCANNITKKFHFLSKAIFKENNEHRNCW